MPQSRVSKEERRHRARRARWAGVVALLVCLPFAVAACGDDSEPASSSSADKGESQGAPADAPTIVLGDKNFTESQILGQLYAQAFRAAGYKVEQKSNIGGTELMDRVLLSGKINAYPEYVGIMVSAIGKDDTVYTSQEEVAAAAKKLQAKRGFDFLTPMTPFEDKGIIVAPTAYAEKHNLSEVGDLKSVGPAKLVMYPPDVTREQGYVGLKREYGIGNVKPIPLDSGLLYQAVDKGEADLAEAFSTDSQLLSGKYKPLEDPKKVYGIQNVGLVIKSDVLKQLGPAFKEAYDKVTPLLTTEVMQQLNKAVVVDKQTPKDVAKAFLEANGAL